MRSHQHSSRQLQFETPVPQFLRQHEALVHQIPPEDLVQRCLGPPGERKDQVLEDIDYTLCRIFQNMKMRRRCSMSELWQYDQRHRTERLTTSCQVPRRPPGVLVPISALAAGSGFAFHSFSMIVVGNYSASYLLTFLFFQKLVYISGKVARRRRTTFRESCMGSSDRCEFLPGVGRSSGGHPSGFAKLHLFLSILTPSRSEGKTSPLKLYP